MAKSFRDDPVMKFISIPPRKSAEPQPAPAAEPPVQPAEPAADPRKKACPCPAPANKNNPKGRRVQLLFRDQLYNDVKSAADAANLSVNEWIHRTLEAALSER